MNQKYKSAFSNVAPSEASVERIINMTKKKRANFKPLIIAAIIAALTLASAISVNAATNGAIVDKVENVVRSVKVFINGEEKDAYDIKYEHRSENFESQPRDYYRFELDGDSYVEFDLDNSGASVNANIEYDNFEATVNEDGKEIELYIPTAKAAEE